MSAMFSSINELEGYWGCQMEYTHMWRGIVLKTRSFSLSSSAWLMGSNDISRISALHWICLTVPNYFINQCWLAINWTFRKKTKYILIKIQIFPLKKMHLILWFGKWHPCCPCPIVLIISLVGVRPILLRAKLMELQARGLLPVFVWYEVSQNLAELIKSFV